MRQAPGKYALTSSAPVYDVGDPGITQNIIRDVLIYNSTVNFSILTLNITSSWVIVLLHFSHRQVYNTLMQPLWSIKQPGYIKTVAQYMSVMWKKTNI